MNKRVLLGMSGGVDSTVAAILLQKQGFEVVAYTFRTYDSINEDCHAKQKGCCTIEAIYEAKAVAEKMNIEHHIADFREHFNNTVISNFVESYFKGQTPNPCVLCNKEIKWNKSIELAKLLNCSYVATGHYANICNIDNRYFLAKGVDENKDQSYFLWQIPNKHLAATLFPLGNMTKDEIRKIAAESGFIKLSEKPDSQEICFITNDDYRSFLKSNYPIEIDKLNGGNFISTDGKILGKHKGYPNYTIGQRKGLEIAMGERMYVIEIRPDTNEVILGTQEDLFVNSMIVSCFNPGKYEKLPENTEIEVRIRYRSNSEKATIKHRQNFIVVNFLNNVSAVTPGQSAVFYENNHILGGGLIIKGGNNL